MPMDVRSQACSYLRNGNVTFFVATPGGDDSTPLAVRAHVQGHSRRYFVRRNYDGRWLCSCEEDGDQCPHIAAVKMITGYPSAARKGQL